MFKWAAWWGNSSAETKWFAFNWAIYLLVIILSTVYCYARLDYVRSYQKVDSKEAGKFR